MMFGMAGYMVFTIYQIWYTLCLSL